MLKQCLPQWRGVVGDDDQFGFALAESFQCLLVAEHVLATLHHQGKARVNTLYGLFLENKEEIF